MGRNKYKAYDTENISGLIVKKFVEKKKDWKCIFFFSLLSLDIKIQWCRKQILKGERGGLDLSKILNKQKVK